MTLQTMRGYRADKIEYTKSDKVVQQDMNGHPINNLTIDICKLTKEKNMGVHLQGLFQQTDTHGQIKRVGGIYSFPLPVISEHTLIDEYEW